MRDCTQKVTIWNKRHDKKTGDYYKRTIISVPCKWIDKIAQELSGTTVNMASVYAVIVPYYKEFLANVGDIVALGIHNVEISGTKPFTASEVKESLLPEVFTVKAVIDNTRSALGKHYRIEG